MIAKALALSALSVLGVVAVASAAGTMHNPIRHHPVRMNGLPAAYQAVKNPYAGNADVLAEGSELYGEHCAMCHGGRGMGDGEAGAELKPPPPMLAPVTQEMMRQQMQQRMKQMQGMGGMGGMGGMRGMGGMGRGPGMGMGRGRAFMMQMLKSDGFLMWTVSEGGEPLGTDMPSYKDVLSQEERWKVISYIQAGLPAGN